MDPPTSSTPSLTMARVAGLVCTVVGLFVLIGWALEIPWIKSVLPGAVEMKVNTALALALAGAALWLLDSENGFPRWIGLLCALCVAAIGFATLGEYALGWNLGIDELFFRDTGNAFNRIRGRMSPYSAVVLAAAGMGLVAVPVRGLRWFVWMSGTFTLLIGCTSIIGYLWNATELVTDRFLPPVAINTSLAFMVLGTGMMASRRQQRPRLARWIRLSAVEKVSLLGFGGTFVLLLLAGGLTYRATVVSAQAARGVVHTQLVRASLGHLYAAASDAESEHHNYLLSNRPEFLDEYRYYAAETQRLAVSLAQLVADNPLQGRRLEELSALVDARMTALQSTATLFQMAGLGAAQQALLEGNGPDLQKQIQALVARMDYEEEKLFGLRETQASQDKAKTLISLLITLTVAIGGYVVLFSAIRREMTNRARAQESLRRSEENLAVTLHSIGDAVLATDTSARVTRMNRVAEKLTGWTHSEALGKPVSEIFQVVDGESGQPTVIPVDTVLRTGEVHGITKDSVLISRDESRFPIADSAAPIRGADGTILGVVLVFRDVSAERAAETALKESEARYRMLFDSIDEGFCIIEMSFDDRDKALDYRFLKVNPSFEKHTGLSSVLGKSMRELVPDHEEHWFEIYGRIARTGVPERFQNRAERLNRTFDVYAFRLGMPAERQVAILIHDITHAKESEERISKLNADLQIRAAELEEANRELEAFSYSVSHDLRAPLRHVHGYVTMLAQESDSQFSDEGRRYLDVISDASVRMGQLIDDLLAFSRMGRTEIRKVAVDLNSLVNTTIQDLEMATKGRRIEWTIPALPRVTGDYSMLKQVFANLIGNAVKYTRDRNPAMIEIGCAGEESGRQVFFIRDNGAGFEMKYAHKLFGVFQRLHRSDEFEGTGIGLAIAQRIISRHGGRTWADGKPGGGATFYFTLAAAAELANDDLQPVLVDSLGKRSITERSAGMAASSRNAR